jgi:hypothetical protein
MTYRGLRNWPPVWSCTEGHNQNPKGEIGTLKAFFGLIWNRLIAAFYIFLMKDQSISAVSYSMIKRSVMELLKTHCNRTIAGIGSCDISHLL